MLFDGTLIDIVAEAGVVGADAISVGTKFDLKRTGGLTVFGGESFRSIAVAGRTGGGGAGEGPDGGRDPKPPAVLGEAVCARRGGGGAVGFAPAVLLTHRLSSLS